MDKTEEIIKSIIDDLARLEFIISKRNKLNLYDINIIAESFIANLLNAFWGCKLINLNTSDENIPSIDLGDEGSSLAVQVTSSKHSRKIQKTLDRFIKNEFDKKYKILKVFIIREKQQSYDHVDTSKLPSFSVKKDILDFNSLIQTLPSIHERLQDIRDVLDREVKKNNVAINALPQDGRSDGAEFFYERYQMDTAVNLKPDVGVDIYFRNVGKENIKINEIISVVFNLDNEECPAPKKFPLIDCECRGDGTFSQPLLIPATQLARYAIAIKLKYQGTISLSKSKSKTFLFLHQGGTLLHPLLGQQQNWNPLFTQATNASDYQQIKARLPKDFHE